MEKIPISILVILISQLSSIGFGIFPKIKRKIFIYKCNGHELDF